MSNTSTLVLLAKATVLETFLENVPQVAIPEEVKEEYAFREDSYYARLIDRMVEEGRIVVKETGKEGLDALMAEFPLDRGEAATYALYRDGDYDAVLTDDGELIKLCRLEGIPFMGAPSVVIRLCEKCPLTKEEAEEKMNELYDLGRYSTGVRSYLEEELEGVEK